MCKHFSVFKYVFMADFWFCIRRWNNLSPSVARHRVITVNIHKAHIYLWHKPQHMIRHLASSARQQICGPVKIRLQKASVAAVDACQNLRAGIFSTPTCDPSRPQRCRGSWPNTGPVYVKSTLSGNLIHLVEAKTARISTNADSQLESRSPGTLRGCLRSQSVTVRGQEAQPQADPASSAQPL